jgi:hypothetical protein
LDLFDLQIGLEVHINNFNPEPVCRQAGPEPVCRQAGPEPFLSVSGHLFSQPNDQNRPVDGFFANNCDISLGTIIGFALPARMVVAAFAIKLTITHDQITRYR